MEILSVLVQDGDSLPQEVMDIILSNILEPKKVGKKKNYEMKMCFYFSVCVTYYYVSVHMSNVVKCLCSLRIRQRMSLQQIS